MCKFSSWAFLILFLFLPAIGQGAVPPAVLAETACVMEVGSKKVLFGKDEAKIMYPASTTKIVTLMVALERGKLDSAVTVNSRAVDYEGSSMELQTGDRLTLDDLLGGLMIASGNDAAEVIAEVVGGGKREQFIAWMNEKAVQAGALKTHFSNPHGLPDPYNHYSTAYDLALITSHGFANPQFAYFANLRQRDVVTANGRKIRLQTHNKFLNQYNGANGVKTGYTNDAGLCLVASAKRNGVQLVAVVLNSDERVRDAIVLLDYGFQTVAQKS